MEQNKKVVNATKKVIDNIEFKSLLEARAYTLLKESGMDFDYEVDKVVLQGTFKPHTLFYKKKNKTFSLDSNSVRAITYTPDFIVRHNNHTIYIETKGFKTDSYNIKVKLFRKWLEQKENTIFAEVTTIRDLKLLIEEIKQL